MVVVNALLGAFAEVVKRVVHPAHIPLVVKAQAALLGGFCHHGVRSGVLRTENSGGVALFKPIVHAAQKAHTAHIVAAVRVAAPVDYSADCVHTQPVKVIFRQPVVCRGFKVAVHNGVGVVKAAAAPFAVSNALMLGFKHGSTVKLRKRVAVNGEMHGDEIHQHGDVVFVAQAHEFFQTFRSAVACCRREKSRSLIPP